MPIYGGSPVETQWRQLRRGVDVVVAIPAALSITSADDVLAADERECDRTRIVVVCGGAGATDPASRTIEA